MAACTSSFVSVSSSLQMALKVSGSGDAKINASMIALSSAEPRRGSCCSSPSCPSSLSCPSCPSVLFTAVLRIPNRMRRVSRPRSFVHANWSETAGLEHPHELEPNHLEQRQERHDQPGPIVHVGEELLEPTRVVL